jgi:hypothetical protein
MKREGGKKLRWEKVKRGREVLRDGHYHWITARIGVSGAAAAQNGQK